MQKLDSSKNLKELDDILTLKKGNFGIELEKRFEIGKSDLEQSVQKGLYSSVV